MGCYLLKHGKVEEGRRHLENALKTPEAHRFMRAIAADHLQRMGVDIKAIGAGPGVENQPAGR